jgi:glycosyltransferase involved in cell wall biosynthesis
VTNGKRKASASASAGGARQPWSTPRRYRSLHAGAARGILPDRRGTGPPKRVELALEACCRAGARAIVVGTGPEAERLTAAYAGRGARFLGRVDDNELASLYKRCLALLVPNVEAFGIAAVEAQAAGRPVLAVGGGAVRETVIDGETGVLVTADTDQLAESMRHTDLTRFSAEACVRSGRRFAATDFRRRLVKEVQRILIDGESG